MPSWLSRLFGPGKGDPASPEPRKAVSPFPSKDNGETTYIALASRPAAVVSEREPQGPGNGKPRRKVVNPPVIVEESEKSAWSPEIRIKALVEKTAGGCVFLVDRPVLEGHSAWFAAAESASASPLAESLFGVQGVETVLLHDFTVTITRSPSIRDSWEGMAREIGARIRAHLKAGKPVLSVDYQASIPSETEIRSRIQQVIDNEVNPGVAAHSGVITLIGVTGNTIRIHMGGGCQGCAASTVTLKEGIHKAFRLAVPQIGAILDETDHSAGTNPYYDQLPAGMSQNA